MKPKDILIALLLLLIYTVLLICIVIVWLVNWPIRKILGYEHRNLDYFLNCLADRGPIHPGKGQRFGSWNPFHESDWY